MKIAGISLGLGRTFVIAEAGVNHNGDLQRAKQLIDLAADAGADAVKFQLFDPDEIVGEDTPMAAYQQKNIGNTKSQKEMLSDVVLSHEDFVQLASLAQKRSIAFIVTPFDIASARFLLTLNVPAIKIPSCELNNLPFLQKIAELRHPVILSTGTGSLDEVREAVAIFQNTGTDLAILHCTSAYPTPINQVNLRVMDTLRKEFNIPVGLSDHTEGITVPIAAVARGAAIIEKHFTLDRSLPGPDHKASLEPDELTKMVREIRNVEEALGTTEKIRQPAEENTAEVARRSIVVIKDLPTGTILTEEVVTIRRPGTGMPPKELSNVLGKTLACDIAANTMLSPEMLS